MIPTGNTKKMVMGGWILATLFIVAYNGFQLAPLFSPPIVGYSDAVKSVIGKRHSFETQVLSARQSARQFDPAGITAGVDRSPEKKEEPISAPPPSIASETTSGAAAGGAETESPPPKLQGIFRVSDIHGNVKLRALLAGKIMREKDRIGDFTVKQISDKGVLLTKDERSWFLESPNVPFSFAREE
ncbi:MAG: hypothetical protein V2B19_22240 [Pseudomonadota bacterium]